MNCSTRGNVSLISRSGDSGDMPRASGLLTEQHPGEVVTSKRGDSTTYCVSRSGYNRPECNASRVQVQPPLMLVETGCDRADSGPARNTCLWLVCVALFLCSGHFVVDSHLSNPSLLSLFFYPNVQRSDKK